MKFLPLRALAALALLLLGGCATYKTSAEHGHSLAGVQRYFVVTNLNDNHGLDQQISAALKGRGLESDTGPLTMMPDKTQAVISYRDNWSWDFGDHLVFLAISVRETRSEQSFATVTFSATVPLKKPVPQIVDQLVGRLLPAKS